LLQAARNKLVQALSLVLSVLSMGALFFIPGVNLLTPAGIALSMGVLAANEGVAFVADRLGVPTLHSHQLLQQALEAPGKWLVQQGHAALPNWFFGDFKGRGKASSVEKMLLHNRELAARLSESLNQTPMFKDVSQELRQSASLRGKAWVLLRTFGALLPPILLARLAPGKKLAWLNALLLNTAGAQWGGSTGKAAPAQTTTATAANTQKRTPTPTSPPSS
jgi:hypothetical protein